MYRRPSMELSEFNSDFGNFNADLLKFDQNSNILDFLDLMYSSLLLPHIFSPTRTTTTSATLIDNTFINNYNSSLASENLVNTLSDLHAQFLIMGNQHSSLEVDTTEKKFRDFREIDKNKIIINSLLENVDWVTELYLSCNDIDLPSELFLKKKEKLISFGHLSKKYQTDRKSY